MEDKLEKFLQRLEVATTKLESLAAQKPPLARKPANLSDLLQNIRQATGPSTPACLVRGVLEVYGSVGPQVDNYQEHSAFSSRAASPQRNVYQPSMGNFLSSYQNVDASKNITGEEFLEKLRRQKEEIERTLSNPIETTTLVHSPPPFQREEPLSRSAHEDFGRREVPINRTVSSSSIPTPLFKTKSESVLDYSRSIPIGPPVRDDKFSRFTFNPTYDEYHQQQSNFNRLSMPPFRQMDDRTSLADRNWMTNPPPPINMDPRPQRPDYNGNFGGSFPFNLGDTFKTGQTIVPIKLDDDRILKIFAPQPTTDESKVTSPLNVRTTQSSVRSPPQSGYSSNDSYKRFSSESVPTSPLYPPEKSDEPRDRYAGFFNQSAHIQSEDPSLSRLSRVHSVSDFNRDRFLNPEYGEVGYSDSSYIVSNNTPINSYKTQVSVGNTREDDTKKRDSFYGPVSSKVFPGHNRINGFINESTPVSAGSFKPVDCVGAPPIQKRERSFVVVSRPNSPSVTLETTGEPPTNHSAIRKREFSPIRYERNNITSPIHDISNQRYSNFSPTNSVPTPRSLGSPISNYDNDSETENNNLKWNSRNGNIVPYRAIQPVPISQPPGILVKNHDASRPPKRVVFQCDSDIMERLRSEYGLPSAGTSETPAHIRSFEDAMDDTLSNFGKVSQEIGGEVAVMSTKVFAIFDELKTFLWTAAGKAEPANDEKEKLLAPMMKTLGEINSLKDAARNSPLHNNLCAVAEGVPAVGFVTVPKTPAPHIQATLEASMYYLNRILKTFKDSNPKQIEWVKSFKQVLESLYQFVRQTHTTGLVWNSAPGSAPSGSALPKTAPPPPPAGGPPPPPPPPANLMAGITSKASDDKAGRDALFAELNKGEAITSKLKKVTSDMQTHKNPNLRATSTVTGTPGASPAKSASPAAKPVVRPPKIELQDCKQWNIEYQVNNRDIVINIEDKKQTMYVYKCENCVIQVKGKLNSITLDGCKKTSIVFDALVAQCETINCQSVQIQTLGEMPTLSIQKTDGCQVYLSEASLGAEIVTSKSSEMNILIPAADGEFSEMAVPEQFKTVIQKGKLVTVASDII
ncbi:unnamed protein product [Auanema sp. JU1783]|nr:unnamed protein product [Auanema sp. JU1783]